MPRLSKTPLPFCHGLDKAAWNRTHSALKKNPKLWQGLAVDGIQCDGRGGLIESRRCPGCGSSLSRRTTALQAVETLSMLAAVHARSLEAIVSAGAAAQGVASCKGTTG